MEREYKKIHLEGRRFPTVSHPIDKISFAVKQLQDKDALRTVNVPVGYDTAFFREASAIYKPTHDSLLQILNRIFAHP